MGWSVSTMSRPPVKQNDRSAGFASGHVVADVASRYNRTAPIGESGGTLGVHLRKGMQRA
jgi:hypothetical protein